MQDVPASKERLVIFIDGSNFYHSVRDTFGMHDNVDLGAEGFAKLIETLKGSKMLIGVYYYNASLDRGHNEEIYWKQQKFFAELKRIPGFHVVLCRLRKDGEGKYTVKGDDIQIAVDMIRLAYENAYDTAILVSGDGDFVPAIKTVQKLGKKVGNAFFRKTSSDFLKRVCDSSVLLDEIIAEIFKEEK